MTDDYDDIDRSRESPMELFERVSSQLSRRSFLGTTAKVGAGGLALSAAGSGTAAAQEQNGELTDLDILNFALLLERLEATFYEEAVGTAPVGESGGGGTFSERDVENSEVAKQFSAEPAYRYGMFAQFQRIRDHERSHVEALASAIEKAGGNPVGNPGFSFPYETVAEFTALGQVFEDTGAAAYTWAAPKIDNADYVAPAAQILAVEARHASYLRFVDTTIHTPFPNAFQQTLSMAKVKERVKPFIQG